MPFFLSEPLRTRLTACLRLAHKYVSIFFTETDVLLTWLEILSYRMFHLKHRVLGWVVRGNSSLTRCKHLKLSLYSLSYGAPPPCPVSLLRQSRTLVTFFFSLKFPTANLVHFFTTPSPHATHLASLVAHYTLLTAAPHPLSVNSAVPPYFTTSCHPHSPLYPSHFTLMYTQLPCHTPLPSVLKPCPTTPLPICSLSLPCITPFALVSSVLPFTTPYPHLHLFCLTPHLVPLNPHLSPRHNLASFFPPALSPPRISIRSSTKPII